MKRLLLCALVGSLATVMIAGCSGIERAAEQPSPSRADAAYEVDVPQAMRGTVASETIIRGYQQVIVHGYGLVVGLNGTGSRDMPPALRAHMLGELARHGIGSEREGLGHLSPEMMLNSLDTAIVVVEGLIPPASVEGARFDVRVYADPRTGTTSLDGGRLYTTELRPATGGRLPAVGSRQAFALAEAGGPVFVNPFAEPSALGTDTVTRSSGRILNGGRVTKSIPMKLQLASPSHSRAAAIQDAINAHFPQEPGQRSATARGESDELIEITVPPSYADDTAEFVNLIRHTTLRLSQPESVAVSIRRAVVQNPASARIASWRWEALGKRALPVIRELYDYPEELPRLAALRAGARLDDPMTIPHLRSLIAGGSPDSRIESIDLLANMPVNPGVDQALRDLLDDPDVDIRLAAYEALVDRGDPFIDQVFVDDKFIIDLVASDHPMLYVSQSRQPRLVVFGKNLAISTPTFVSAWSNRFMIQSDSAEPVVEVYYRDINAAEGGIARVQADVPSFTHFLGHRTTVERPDPGLGLSYGETVGLLHQIWRQGYIKADFKAEQDRILAAILREESGSTVEARPEFSDAPERTGEPVFSDLDVADDTGSVDFLQPEGLEGGDGSAAREPGRP